MNKDDPLALSPHSVEAEECVLGALLMNGGAFFDVEAHLTPDDFFVVRHGWIYEAMQHIVRRNHPIDPRTLAEELRAVGRLDGVGGEAFLNYLPTTIPSALYAEVYAMIVEHRAIRRRLLAAASEVARLAHDENMETPAAVTQAQQVVMDVRFRADTTGVVSAGQAVSAVFDKLERARHQQTQVIGIPSPFTDLDRQIGGWQAPDFVVVAGRPGMGKSAMLLQMVYHAAAQGTRVLFFSLEMNAEQIMRRLFAQRCGVPYQQQTRMTDDQWKLFAAFVAEVESLPLHFKDGAELTPYQLRRAAQEHRRTHGLDMVVTDYLQLMQADGRTDNRVAAVTEIAQAHKTLALALGIPVITASQLSRGVEARADKHPMLSDLRESGGIEQAADIVLFPFREGYYTGDKQHPKPADFVVDCDIAKHRNGEPGFCNFVWDGPSMTFRNAEMKSVPLNV